MTTIKSEDMPKYWETPAPSVAELDDALIAQAIKILEKRVRSTPMSRPQDVKDWLRLRAAGLEHEEFSIMFLDGQHNVIETEMMFRGTLTQCSIYPREVVKRALTLNAAAVVLSHNHPSGSAEPSRADEFLTQTLKNALALIDCRVLDHVVVADGGVVSFAERGLL